MPTLTFKATEMQDAKVAHISLVDRAATRIPFKVIKQEKPTMSVLKHLDLASVFKKDKPVAQPPEIVGVITMKGEGFESVKAQIAEAGFVVTKEAVMEDESVLFGQSEDMSGDHVLIRLSENAVMAVKRFSPYNMEMGVTGDTSFAEVCKAQGFYPGVGTMVDVLRNSVLTLAEKADDSAAAAVQVGKMFDEAKQYAMTMVSALPSKAFKLENIQPEITAPVVDPVVVGKACAPKAGDTDGDEGMSDEDKAKAMAKMKAKKEDGSDADATVVDPAPPPAAAPAGEAAAPAISEATVTELVNKGLTEFSTKMETLLGGLTKSVEAVGTSVQSLTTRVEAAEGVAKAASEAVTGTVVLGSDAGDQTVVAHKSEGQSRGREIDTAYLPRSQRNASGRR